MTDERPLGASVPNWQPVAFPERAEMRGNYAVLEPLRAAEHAAALFEANRADDRIWDYLFEAPFHSEAAYFKYVKSIEEKPDQVFYAVRDRTTGKIGGMLSLMRIDTTMGVIEVGNINFAPQLQRTRAATEAIYLLMDWVFGAGYRRFEWKCNALNAPSRRAAERFGFSYEGIFRQALVIKGRNRDTAWFAMTDQDWPAAKAAYGTWLAPENFDAQGQQKERLGDLTRLVRVASDPSL